VIAKVRAALLLLALAVLTGSACVSNCSDVGCADQLTVYVSGVVPDSFSVTLAIPDGEPTTSYCPAVCFGQPQGTAVVFMGSPSLVVVVVHDARGIEIGRGVAVPDYVEGHPNGPTCPPTCKFGEVTITLERGDADALRAETGPPFQVARLWSS
jgi:hypothetical protein